jgi:MerR family transcriptional regulator, light-induced transcriptional regulator
MNLRGMSNGSGGGAMSRARSDHPSRIDQASTTRNEHGSSWPSGSWRVSAPPQAKAEELTTTVCCDVLPRLVGRNASRSSARHERDEEKLQVDEFTRLLLAEADQRCESMLRTYVEVTGDPQAAAEALLAPAARLVGDYWRMDICDFMQVTVVMTRIQRLFWRIATENPPAGPVRAGRAALLAPAPGEQHAFGLSVVEDAFRRDGWHVDCCGSGDGTDFLRLAESSHYALIGLSLSSVGFLPDLARIIRRLRTSMLNKSASIVVGGAIFVDKPELANEVGADSLALSARDAVVKAALATDGGTGHGPVSVTERNWNAKASDGQAGLTRCVPLVWRQPPLLGGTGR